MQYFIIIQIPNCQDVASSQLGNTIIILETMIKQIQS